MTLRCLFLVAILVGGAVPGAPLAQDVQTSSIEGRVLDAETNDPLPGTHVFVSRSMVGTTTDSTGRFRLNQVPPGSKRLYVSRIGHANRTITVRLHPGRPVTFTFRLEQEVLQGPAVTVSSERDEEWYERLRRFERLFIGESPRAKHCTLVNPEVLRFEEKWWGKFEARAEEPLIIENRALGYRLKYFLKEFEKSGPVVRWDGEPLFEPLSPDDSLQAAQWQKRRHQAYRGSLRHFLRALRKDRLEAEQFDLFRIPRASAFRYVNRADQMSTTRDRILEPGPDSTYLFDVRGRLEVIYRGEPESKAYLEWANLDRRTPREYQTSQIKVNEHPIHVDRYGEFVEPYGATLYRYFAYTIRMAELLPREYEPPE